MFSITSRQENSFETPCPKTAAEYRNPMFVSRLAPEQFTYVFA
jgi:hypothetical protein